MKQILAFVVSIVAVCRLAASVEQPQPDSKKPQFERLLQGEDAKRAAELIQTILTAERAQRYDEAKQGHEKLLALRTKLQGADHWQTVSQRWLLDRSQKLAALSAEEQVGWHKAFQGVSEARQLDGKGQHAEAAPLWQAYHRRCVQVFGEKHPITATAYINLAVNLYVQRKYADAEPLIKKALAIQMELLGEMHLETAISYNGLAANLEAQGKFADAQPLLQKALALTIELLGEKYLDTSVGYTSLALNLAAQNKYAEAQPFLQKALVLRLELLGEKHPATAASYIGLAFNLDALGRHVDAQAPFEKALALNLELFGEKHLDTATSYNGLGLNLNAQAKYADAQPLLQKALNLRLELLGEKHPDTATSYASFATNLFEQGRYADAQPLLQKALALRLELLGEKHRETAASYGNLAGNLNAQGKYSDAEPLFQKALAIFIELFGEKHRDTAIGYNNLGENLRAQRKYADAQPLLERALGLNRELLGEKHRQTAITYDNVALNLVAQGKFADAEPLFRKALAINIEVLGENHTDTAKSYNNLASSLLWQRQYADAQLLQEKALALNIELLGEKHPNTANVYSLLAENVNAQGKHAEAESLYKNALAIEIEVLGEKHPSTAAIYHGLAFNLQVQRKYADARVVLERATASYEAARLIVASRGLERAVFGAQGSPYSLLAVTQAQHHSPSAAWLAAETDLARGLSDEIAFRRGAALRAEEQHRLVRLTSRLNELQPRILQLVSQQSPTDSEKDELATTQAERTKVEAQLAELAVTLSQREVATLAQVQGAIPVAGALICWVDLSGVGYGVNEHWGCMVRRTGEPIWERLPGTGVDGNWTDDDTALAGNLRDALASGTVREADVAALAQKLHAQRLAPLARHLEGVKTLYVAAVNTMAGIPLEVLTHDFTISYVPSGTFLARLSKRDPASSSGLLALGDPVFTRRDAKPNPATDLPPGGLLITIVAPDSPASKAQLQSGDVLVRYGDVGLNSIEQIAAEIRARATAKEVPITVWREGEKQLQARNVPPGRLFGVAFEKQPAREVITNRRQADALLASLRGASWSELPGTRAEVMQIAELFGNQATTRLDSAASEQGLEELRNQGKLSKFRYLHLATHGAANDVQAFESVLILAQDKLPPDPLPRAGEPFVNGQLSAGEVLEFWNLNSDLVTLSACETALGRAGGGDGLLGFAQAFLTAGSRAICLSLWKVDDTATALLMTRFYQNLLGKRVGLTEPMPKAKALAEAKDWLRELSAQEALQLTAAATSGVVRGDRAKGEDLKLVVPAADPIQPETKSAKPFSHPRYWSAFILIGDPN